MRRLLTLGGVAFVAMALSLSGNPASAAGTLTWTDPASDSAPLGLAAPSPISEPAFDITRSTISSDGTTLTWKVEVPGITADPPPKATGMHFTFAFKFGENSYRWVVVKDRVAAGGTSFYKAGTAGSSTADCAKCIGKIDVKDKSVTLTAPIASMDRGIDGKFGPGSKLEAVSVGGGRFYEIPLVVSYFPTDDVAPAPAPGTFAV